MSTSESAGRVDVITICTGLTGGSRWRRVRVGVRVG